MKIAQVTPVYPPKGGIGTVAKEYADGLSSDGNEVTVFTPSYKKGLYWGNAALMPKLLWQLRGFDIVHLHYPFYGGAFFTFFAAKIHRIPLVTTYHMKTVGSGWLGLIFFLCQHFVEPFILHGSDKIFVSSLDYAESIGLEYPQLVELPFSVDTVRFSPGTSKKIHDLYNIKSDATVFIFVGGMDEAHYFKGIERLLRALVDVRNTKWHLILVGEGSLKNKYRILAQTLGIAGQVTFAGFVENEDLPDYYKAADVHVLPSIDASEAFGLVTLEAAATGIPSIVSDLPGVRSLVLDEQTGLHIGMDSDKGMHSNKQLESNKRTLLQAIEFCLVNKESIKQYGNKARKRIKMEYSRKSCLKKLQDLYKLVV